VINENDWITSMCDKNGVQISGILTVHTHNSVHAFQQMSGKIKSNTIGLVMRLLLSVMMSQLTVNQITREEKIKAV
jgi:hypothetical protein